MMTKRNEERVKATKAQVKVIYDIYKTSTSHVEILEKIAKLYEVSNDIDTNGNKILRLKTFPTNTTLNINNMNNTDSNGNPIPLLLNKLTSDIYVPRTLKEWFVLSNDKTISLEYKVSFSKWDDNAAKNLAAAIISTHAKEYFENLRYEKYGNIKKDTNINMFSDLNFSKEMFEKLTIDLDRDAIIEGIERNAKELLVLDEKVMSLKPHINRIIPKVFIYGYKDSSNKTKYFNHIKKRMRRKKNSKYVNYDKLKLYFLLNIVTPLGIYKPTNDVKNYKLLIKLTEKIIKQKGVFTDSDRDKLKYLEEKFGKSSI